ncbi:MAG: zinc-ribbon domain-containing protein [Lachnospiraceae bacterium]|nr:zinc-ribbon domain-containing protein [Lachnospiraceae bacterium]
MFCTNCGKKIDDDCKFCIYCGFVIPRETPVKNSKSAAMPKAEDAWGRPAPGPASGYDDAGGRSYRGYSDSGPAGRGGMGSLSNVKDLDIKLGLGGAICTALSVFFDYFSESGYGVSLISEELIHLGVLFLIYAIMAGIAVWLRHKRVFMAMTTAILVFVIYLGTLLGDLLGAIGDVGKGFGFWLMWIGIVIMVIAGIMMFMELSRENAAGRRSYD